MRVVVTGATGNVGTSVIRRLAEDDAVKAIVGVARRRPGWTHPKVSWRAVDITCDDLAPVVADADVIVHLAWLIQPSHDQDRLWEVNVRGTARLLEAAETVGAPAVVYASSVGAYSSGPRDGAPVDESWPTDGIATSSYSQAKAYTERLLDTYEARNPGTRVVRLRPGLIFKAEAATRIRRLFLGPAFPRRLVSPALVPLLPRVRGLSFQCVHTDDVAEAFRLATVRPVSGAFNLAAGPVLTLEDVADTFDARTVAVPARLLRGLVTLTWRARLQPIDAGWFDLAYKSPLLDTRRAREELGWSPQHGARAALEELLRGIRQGERGSTPPLEREQERAHRDGDG